MTSRQITALAVLAAAALANPYPQKQTWRGRDSEAAHPSNATTDHTWRQEGNWTLEARDRRHWKEEDWPCPGTKVSSSMSVACVPSLTDPTEAVQRIHPWLRFLRRVF